MAAPVPKSKLSEVKVVAGFSCSCGISVDFLTQVNLAVPSAPLPGLMALASQVEDTSTEHVHGRTKHGLNQHILKPLFQTFRILMFTMSCQLQWVPLQEALSLIHWSKRLKEVAQWPGLQLGEWDEAFPCSICLYCLLSTCDLSECCATHEADMQ